MGLHRNARLGLAGRRALVARRRVGLFVSGRRRDAAASRRRPPASGGGAGRRRRSSSAARLPVSRIARRGRTAVRGCCRRPSRQRICAARRRIGLGAAADRGRDRPCARDRLADATAGGDLAAAAGSRASGRAATSGPAPATCCTSTASASSASAVPATPSPATATAPAPRSGCGSATSGCTRSSTTTPGYAYSELHRDERAATVTGFVERGLAFFAAHGIEAEAAAQRQRLRLPPQPLPARAARPTAASAIC